MEMSADIEGLDELLRAMEALPGLVAEHVQGAGLHAAAEVVRDEAKQTSEFADKTGALRASIRARRVAGRVHTGAGVRKVPGAAARVEAGGAGARQAYLIEYGRAGGVSKTGKRYPAAPPHPYLEPALTGTASRQLMAAVASMRQNFARVARQITAGRATKTIKRLAAQ